MNLLQQYGFQEPWITEAKQNEPLIPARVVSQYQGVYGLVTEEGECRGEPTGKYRHLISDPALFPTVGDYVLLEKLPGADEPARIARILSRKSIFSRAAAGTEKRTQLIAANIDLLFLCMSLNENFSLSRAERYLSAAWDSGAVPVVLLTKSDLAQDLPAALSAIESAAPGTEVIAVSSLEEDATERVLSLLKPGMTGSFVGSSGVGKSTLINRLLGIEALETGAIRADGKGKHTTTHRELVRLPSGALVIDTPGMRELAVESVDLTKSFPEIDALAAECRFSDCTHTAEPGCAVRAAIEAGTLDPRRLESYQKLCREARYTGLGAKKLESEKLNAMFEGVGGMKNVRKYIRQNDKRKR